VDGRCTVSGLQRASYILAVEHPWAMLRTRLKDGYYVDVGGEQELEIVFEEPLVVAFAISSRPTIKWFVTPQPRMRAPHPGAAQYGGLVMRLRHQAEQLGLADSFYSYVVTKGELAIGQSVQVVYHVPGLGWNVAAVPFVNASLSSLVVIDPAEPHPCSERGLVVRYLTPDGQLSSLSSCRLELLDLADSSSCPVELSPRLRVWDVQCGERIVVPCGNYRIRPPRVAHGFETEHPSTLRVVPGVGDQSVEIREVHPMVRVRIDAMTQDGTVLGFYHLRIHRLDQPASYQHTYSTTYPEVFVPLGVYQFEVHLPGFEVGVLEHTFLDASPEACHETLVLSRVE